MNVTYSVSKLKTKPKPLFVESHKKCQKTLVRKLKNGLLSGHVTEEKSLIFLLYSLELTSNSFKKWYSYSVCPPINFVIKIIYLNLREFTRFSTEQL